MVVQLLVHALDFKFIVLIIGVSRGLIEQSLLTIVYLTSSSCSRSCFVHDRVFSFELKFRSRSVKIVKTIEMS